LDLAFKSSHVVYILKTFFFKNTKTLDVLFFM